MAYLIDLELAKAHLRVEHEEDDRLIATYIEAAEGLLEHLINRPLTDPLLLEYDVAEQAYVYPETLRQAALLLLGRMYADREGYRAGRMTELPYSVAAMAKPYRMER